jgi:hypothetical protein
MVMVMVMGFVLGACAEAPPPVAPVSPPSTPAAQVRPAMMPPGNTAGRLDALRRHEASLLDLIKAIEADGVEAAELSDLARVQSRLHATRAEIITVEAEATEARLRLRALTGTLGRDEVSR